MKFCVQSGLICLQLYPDQDGVSTVPREVELALANGLSLADQPSRALSLLKNTRYMYTVCSNTAYTEDCMMQVVVELESNTAYTEDCMMQVVVELESNIAYTEDCMMQVVVELESNTAYTEDCMMQVVVEL